MARLAPVLTIATVVVALLAGGVGTASAAPPTCNVPAAKTIRPDAMATTVPDCGLGQSGGGALVTITTPPAHGSVKVQGTITGPWLKYLPAAGYTGPDAYAFTVTSPGGVSAPVTQQITVDPAANAAPVCTAPTTAKVR